jgi:hypothetical protein
MSLTSYQTALPRNRGLGLYAKWLHFVEVVDKKGVNMLKHSDIGWLFLLCGLVLAVSAIILPAHQDLENLETKRNAIQSDLDYLAYRIDLYREFLQDIDQQDPIVQQRLISMQFNLAAEGTPVVIDSSASHTPLEWIAERSRRDHVIATHAEESSLLSGLSSGRSRLLLVGGAVFAMFIGFLKKEPAHPKK